MYKWYINLVMNLIEHIKLIPDKYHKPIKKFFMILYYTITKLTVILLLNFFFKTLKEALIVSVVFMLLRGFSQGIHSKKNWVCWIITLLVFVSTPQLIKHLDINYHLIIYSYPLFIINFMLFAPNDTNKNPLKNKWTRISLKIISTFIVIGYYFYSLNYQNTISDAMYYATIISLVSFHPVTYKIFKRDSYNYRYL